MSPIEVFAEQLYSTAKLLYDVQGADRLSMLNDQCRLVFNNYMKEWPHAIEISERTYRFVAAGLNVQVDQLATARYVMDMDVIATGLKGLVVKNAENLFRDLVTEIASRCQDHPHSLQLYTRPQVYVKREAYMMEFFFWLEVIEIKGEARK